MITEGGWISVLVGSEEAELRRANRTEEKKRKITHVKEKDLSFKGDNLTIKIIIIIIKILKISPPQI